jgi:hypothetical protein
VPLRLRLRRRRARAALGVVRDGRRRPPPRPARRHGGGAAPQLPRRRMLLLLLLLLLLLMLVLLLLILLPMLRRLGHWVVRDTRGRGTRGAQVAAVIGDRFWLRVEVYIQKNQRDVFDSTPKTRLTLTVWAPGSVAAHQCAV